MTLASMLLARSSMCDMMPLKLTSMPWGGGGGDDGGDNNDDDNDDDNDTIISTPLRNMAGECIVGCAERLAQCCSLITFRHKGFRVCFWWLRGPGDGSLLRPTTRAKRSCALNQNRNSVVKWGAWHVRDSCQRRRRLFHRICGSS